MYLEQDGESEEEYKEVLWNNEEYGADYSERGKNSTAIYLMTLQWKQIYFLYLEQEGQSEEEYKEVLL